MNLIDSEEMDALLEQLTRSPKAAVYLEAVNRMLQVEAGARRRFRESLSGSEKAEFINGEVLMHSPANARHLLATGHLFSLLYHYTVKHQLGVVFSEKALIGLSRNDYEPDVCFFPRTTAEQWDRGINVFPAPIFIAEVLSPSTEARDRGVKMEDYAAHQVGEYWLLDPEKEMVEQYVLPPEGEAYDLQFKANCGQVQSTVIDGFEIEVAALFSATANQAALARLLEGNSAQ